LRGFHWNFERPVRGKFQIVSHGGGGEGMFSRNGIICATAALGLLTITACAGVSRGNGEDVRITIQELRQMLGSPDLIVIDVRDPVSWSKTDRKIQGAVREDPKNPSAWKDTYPKDKIIVFYCA
jgi:hypothetical protein